MPHPTTRQNQRLPGWLHELLQRRLREDVELPLLPEAPRRILAMCEDQGTDARAIEGVLERDPSLASHVLRIANSAAYATREPVVSLQQAVSRLGLETMRNIALAVSIESKLFRAPGYRSRVRRIWIQSSVAAAYAREIARLLRRNAEAAFLCSLLHDIGRPVVLQATIDALAHRTRDPLPYSLLETAMNEFHAPVGARLLEEWRLADWAVAAVAHQDEPEKAGPHRDLAGMVMLSDRLAAWALDQGQAPDGFPKDLPVLGALELRREDVETLLAQRGTVLEFAEAFR